MDPASNISSEEKLLQLRNEGKISEAEYAALLEAMNKPASDKAKPSASTEPQFEAFRARLSTFSLGCCIIGLPAGLMLKLPFVWVLSILGIVINLITLSRIEGSWLAKLINERK